MTWTDISMTIKKDMTVYKNRHEKRPKFQQSATFKENGVYETDVTMNLHTGTHIDFPLHTLEDGLTSDSLVLDRLMGKAKVFDLTDVKECIHKADIASLSIEHNDFILFKTANSFDESFNFDWVYVAKDAANYLVEKKVRGVGIDALGIERNQNGHPTHNTLLKNNIIILEGIELKAIEAGVYDFLCLPLKIKDVEALPVRALLNI